MKRAMISGHRTFVCHPLVNPKVEILFDLTLCLQLILHTSLSKQFLTTLFSFSPTGFAPYPIPTPGLHQSCRHVVRTWANQSFGAHLHNMTLSNGKLRVPQDGRYYLYSQVILLYFKYYLIQKETIIAIFFICPHRDEYLLT